MITDLAVGSIVRYRYRGAFEYGRVVAHGDGKAVQMIGAPEVGERVHQGVWKGEERFEARGTWIYSRPMPGDRR